MASYLRSFFKDNAENHETEPYTSKMQKAIDNNMRNMGLRGPSQILPHLYLGSYEDASDLTCIEKHGITHVFNCASGYTRTGPEFYGVKCEYYAIRAEDDREYNIMQHYEEAYKFIESARTSGGRCLIHCLMGINRSGTLAAAYVMMYKNIGPVTVAKEISKKRYPFMSNEQFQKQLVQWAAKKKLLQLDTQHK